MPIKYWDVKDYKGLLACTCPKCGIEKLIMRLGKYKIAKCQFCGAKLRYRWWDRKRFDKGTSRKG